MRSFRNFRSQFNLSREQDGASIDGSDRSISLRNVGRSSVDMSVKTRSRGQCPTILVHRLRCVSADLAIVAIHRHSIDTQLSFFIDIPPLSDRYFIGISFRHFLDISIAPLYRSTYRPSNHTERSVISRHHATDCDTCDT